MTAEQWADVLLDRLNATSMHSWRGIMVATFVEAMEEERAVAGRMAQAGSARTHSEPQVSPVRSSKGQH